MENPCAASGRGVYLRLSVTDRCNLRCRYCRPARDAAGGASGRPAADEELLELVRLIDAEFPLYKIRVTGGEPLLHPDLPGFVRRLRAIMPNVELALTTNAILLARSAQALHQAGVEFLNISIDTLDAAGYQDLTRGGKLEVTLAGLQAAQAAGFRQIRLNAVLMRSYNGGQLHQLVRLARRHNCELRFIELMPFGEGAALYEAEFLSGDEALEFLRRHFSDRGAAPGSATARRHRLLVDGREQIVGFITTVSHPFCETCDRARLDCHGRLSACLRTPVGADLLGPLRDGCLDVVRARIRREVPNKTIPQGVWPSHNLVTIGG
jgi:cyclic pyranopterin phosphate synthase